MADHDPPTDPQAVDPRVAEYARARRDDAIVREIVALRAVVEDSWLAYAREIGRSPVVGSLRLDVALVLIAALATLATAGVSVSGLPVSVGVAP